MRTLRFKLQFWSFFQRICFLIGEIWSLIPYFVMCALLFANMFVWKDTVLNIYITAPFGAHILFVEFGLKKALEKISSKLTEIVSKIQDEQVELNNDQYGSRRTKLKQLNQ